MLLPYYTILFFCRISRWAINRVLFGSECHLPPAELPAAADAPLIFFPQFFSSLSLALSAGRRIKKWTRHSTSSTRAPIYIMIINRSCTSDIRNISRLTCKGYSPHFSFLFLYRLNGYFHLHKRSLHATRRLNSFIFCQECPYDELECIGRLAVKYIGVKSKGQTVKIPTNLHLCQSRVSFQLKSNEFTSSFFFTTHGRLFLHFRELWM